MNNEILLNISFSLGTISISALISFWFSTVINKKAHQMQLRAEKAEEYKTKFLRLKDAIQIAQQQVQIRYLNMDNPSSDLLKTFDKPEIFNRILEQATELNSITNLHGKLFKLDILMYEDVVSAHKPIIDLAFELERAFKISDNLIETKNRLKPLYDEMMKNSGEATNLLLDFSHRIEKQYHKDIK